MDHAFREDYYELGRVEDEVVAEIGCACGWRWEFVAEKGEAVRATAQALRAQHLNTNDQEG